MNIVLIGPHGVGKTSFGRALAEELRIPFHDEIGWRLAQDPAFRPRDTYPADTQERFDEEVFRCELERDREAAIPRVVETWHPGNLAYAAHRSPGVVGRFLTEIEEVCTQTQIVVIPLTAPVEVLARRKHEAGDLDFFIEVGREAERWARHLGLPLLEEIATHESSPRVLARKVVSMVLPNWKTSEWSVPGRRREGQVIG
jgi:hypothetical protein